MTDSEIIDAMVLELYRPIAVLTWAKGMMRKARGNQWVGAHKRAIGARSDIEKILAKYGYSQDGE
jgi:hypothetical protein